MKYQISNVKSQIANLFSFKKIIGSLLLVVLVLIGSILSHKASAQLTVQSITITNPAISVTVNPGEKKEGTVSLINNSNAQLTFVTGVYDFIVTDANGTPQLLPYGTIPNNKYSAANWVAVYPAGFTVKPGERYTLNYYIQIPPDAAPGGHYAALVYQPVTNLGGKGTGASITSQIGSLLYITVNGPVKEAANVTKFNVKPFQEYGPVTVKTQIVNYGDLHVRPEGQITIRNMIGGVVASQDLTKRNIFPGGVAVDYSNTLGSTWIFGRFKAELVGSYGVANNLPLAASVYFWVFPWRVALIVILILIAAILGFLVWKRRKENQLLINEQQTKSNTQPLNQPNDPQNV